MALLGGSVEPAAPCAALESGISDPVSPENLSQEPRESRLLASVGTNEGFAATAGAPARSPGNQIQPRSTGGEVMKKNLEYGTPAWLDVSDYEDAHGIDHPRTYKGKIAIFMPYYAHEQLADFITDIKGQGFCMDISGACPYSSHAFTIMVWRVPDEELALELIGLFRQWSHDPAGYKEWV
jgi:hypothetical protein